MKILHLIFSQQVAGAEKYLLDLLPGLKQHGVDCDLICVIPEKDSHKFKWFCQELNDKGVKNSIIVADKFKLLSAAKKINEYIRKHNITYIHAHLFKSDMLAVLVKKLFNKKVHIISTRHGYQESYFNINYLEPGKITRNLYYYISLYLLKSIDTKIAISKAISDLYFKLKLTKEPAHYIHHGVAVEAHQTKDVSIYKKATPQLIIVGRIEKIKGHSYLLEAMPSVVKEFPSVQLLVIGNGTEKETLNAKAKDLGIENNISFLGFQKDPYSYIAGSDIIILPSLYEPFGLVFIEAFALKTPVIAFDVQACNEIIVNNETGVLVPLFNSNAIAEKILLLLHNEAERKRIAANAYQRYIDYFNKERMIAETAQWYKSFIFY